MICKKCGAQMGDSAKFCSACGTQLEQQSACPHCAGALRPGAKFCIYCGRSVVAVNTPEPSKTEEKPMRKELIIGILAVALVIAVGVAAFFVAHSLTPQSQEPTYGTEATLPPDTGLALNQAELTYTLTDADVEAFYTQLEVCERVCIDGTDVELADAETERLDALYDDLEAQYTTAMILYYCDLSDENASALYLEATDLVTQANNDYLEMARRVYLSDSPAKAHLFADWTQQELDMLVNYSSEVMELQQRNSEIEVAYQDLQNDVTMYDAMVPLFTEMVCNNNRIAQIYGYDNYYDYAYEQSYCRDYSAQEVADMRAFAARYLPGALSGSIVAYYEKSDELTMHEQFALYDFLDESFQESETPYVANYLSALPQGMREDMLRMFDGDILMRDDAYGAQEGAFTANIGMDRLVCYFGPGYSNAETVVHEVGHYYGAVHNYLPDIPLDLAETQSQGNEWLFVSYLADEMDEDVYEAFVDYRTYSDMVTVLVSLLVDEFEQRVYTHPDVASLTGDDLDAIMEQVCQAYGGIALINDLATDIQYYWRLVVIEQPVYYISYAVSAVAAMDLYTVAREDFDQAVEVYRMLNEEADLDQGFLWNISHAGLKGPFEEDVYKALYEQYQ